VICHNILGTGDAGVSIGITVPHLDEESKLVKLLYDGARFFVLRQCSPFSTKVRQLSSGEELVD